MRVPDVCDGHFSQVGQEGLEFTVITRNEAQPRRASTSAARRVPPLDPRYHHDDPGREMAWQRAKARHPPRTGSIARYRITAHLDTTRRIMVTPHDTPDRP